MIYDLGYTVISWEFIRARWWRWWDRDVWLLIPDLKLSSTILSNMRVLRRVFVC